MNLGSHNTFLALVSELAARIRGDVAVLAGLAYEADLGMEVEEARLQEM